MKRNNVRRAAVVTGLVLVALNSAIGSSRQLTTTSADDQSWFSERAFAGHTLKLLPDGARLTAARHDLIENAKKSIYISTFAIKDDATGRDIVERLCAKARQGLDVRLLADHWGSMDWLRHADHLRKCGARVLSHDPWDWGATWFRQALHEKLLIADGERVITGGSGYADYYAEAGHDAKEWHDLDVDMTGVAACWYHMRFRQEWTWTARQDSYWPDRSVYADENGQKILERLYGLKSFATCSPKSQSGGARVYPLEQDPMFEGGKWLLKTHIAAVKGSHHRIRLFSPYFVPDEKLIRALLDARARGVEVTVVTNSSASTDEPNAHLGLLKIAPRLLKAGIEIRMWNHHNMLHRKGGIYDDHWVFFGSDNLDRGAHNYNAENIAFTDDPDFVRDFNGAFDEDLADTSALTEQEVRVELDHESLWHKTVNSILFNYI